jgi:hypothetical protein
MKWMQRRYENTLRSPYEVREMSKTLGRSDSGKGLVGRIGYTEAVVDIYFKNDEYEKNDGKRGISNEFLSEECTKATVGI